MHSCSSSIEWHYYFSSQDARCSLSSCHATGILSQSPLEIPSQRSTLVRPRYTNLPNVTRSGLGHMRIGQKGLYNDDIHGYIIRIWQLVCLCLVAGHAVLEYCTRDTISYHRHDLSRNSDCIPLRIQRNNVGQISYVGGFVGVHIHNTYGLEMQRPCGQRKQSQFRRMASSR